MGLTIIFDIIRMISRTQFTHNFNTNTEPLRSKISIDNSDRKLCLETTQNITIKLVNQQTEYSGLRVNLDLFQ